MCGITTKQQQNNLQPRERKELYGQMKGKEPQSIGEAKIDYKMSVVKVLKTSVH